MTLSSLEIAQHREEKRAAGRKKKRHPSMIMTGKGMKRFASPKKPGAR